MARSRRRSTPVMVDAPPKVRQGPNGRRRALSRNGALAVGSAAPVRKG